MGRDPALLALNLRLATLAPAAWQPRWRGGALRHREALPPLSSRPSPLSAPHLFPPFLTQLNLLLHLSSQVPARAGLGEVEDCLRGLLVAGGPDGLAV